LIARYGSDNGFGWQAGEVVGAQIVSVPLESATAGARRVLRQIMLSIAVILVATLVIVNALLYVLIVRPVRRMAAIADEVSLGNVSAGEFSTRGSAELVALARSFNRMRTSLQKALKLLEP